ncbi:hypothetical protein B7H18_08820 [Pseudomonas putida]|uniref:Uncharacterized protein n=1 Tax=Pseudomonas putida TaxID=303 RepID=A0A1X0ZMK9_PSEPU|nr:hypothetical protein B7H18_08820 [Pseudomonas putida]ORL58615.1 hypothetical protein B7H17_24045 [Pseudomonas putida]ORL65492.1 hypothetical protein B7H19_22290 [Pseudomonas putida]PLP85647.1 hypothetical protein CX682_30285 [Pseudomonas sp. FFUP_PS_41]
MAAHYYSISPGRFVVIDVPSNLIWIIGLVLLVMALAFLWNMKLSTHAAQSLSLDKQPESAEPETEIPKYKSMPVLAPAPPPVVLEIEHVAPEIEVVEDATDESTASVYEPIPDSDDAERMLDLAWKLEVHGDFEGRDEYAKLVLENVEASARQRDRAQAMLRNDSIS